MEWRVLYNIHIVGTKDVTEKVSILTEWIV